ncbi:MAG: hemerythrin domain-containing protein [Terracoccus sp.]
MTSPHGSAPAPSLPLPARAAVALEDDTRLDPAVDRLGALTSPLADGAVGDALRGKWLGHALHPALTDLPLGLWTATTVLDLVGGPGARPAAQRLVGLGLLAVPPTAASGWSEWHRSDRPAQRVGVAHVALNVAAIGLYAGSWLARRGDRHRVGAALALMGAGAAGAGGYLGGHLASVRKVSSEHPAFSSEAASAPSVAPTGSPVSRDAAEPATSAAPVDSDLTAAIAGQHTRIDALVAGVGHAPVERREEALHELLSLLAAHEAVEEELIHPVLPILDDREMGLQRAEEERGMAQQLGRLEELDIDSPTFRLQFGLFEEALSYHAHAEEHEELPAVVARISEADAAFIVSALAQLETWAATSTGSFAEMLEAAREQVRSLTPG